MQRYIHFLKNKINLLKNDKLLSKSSNLHLLIDKIYHFNTYNLQNL